MRHATRTIADTFAHSIDHVVLCPGAERNNGWVELCPDRSLVFPYSKNCSKCALGSVLSNCRRVNLSTVPQRQQLIGASRGRSLEEAAYRYSGRHRPPRHGIFMPSEKTAQGSATAVGGGSVRNCRCTVWPAIAFASNLQVCDLGQKQLSFGAVV